MALTIRITSEDGTVQELELEPGAEIQVAKGDSIAIIDSQGQPIEIAVDDGNESNVVVTVLAPEGQQQVIIDGIVYGTAGEDETFTFVDLALYIEDEDIASSISFVDPDSEEVTVVADIEELLAGFSTAVGGAVIGAGFTPGIAPDPNDPNLADPLGVPPQDPPLAGVGVPEFVQGDDDDDGDDESEPGNVSFLAGEDDFGQGTDPGKEPADGSGNNAPSGSGSSFGQGGSGGTSTVDIDADDALLITNIAQGGPVQVIEFPASALLHTGPDGAVSLIGDFSFAEGIEDISLDDGGTPDDSSDDTVTILMNPSFPNADLDAFTYDYEDSDGGTQTATVGILRDVPGALDGIAKPGDPSDPVNLGNDANNILVNLKGNEEILGGIGDDVLVGGENKDTLEGGAGSDYLVGGEGDDILYGDSVDLAGGGADTFVIRGEDIEANGRPGSVHTDEIRDFEIGDDVLDLSDIFADAGVSADNDGEGGNDNLEFRQVGVNTEVRVDLSESGGDFSGDAIVVLLNVTATDLTLGGNVNVDV